MGNNLICGLTKAEYNRQWYQQNKERSRENHRQARAKNREHYRIIQARYRATHPRPLKGGKKLKLIGTTSTDGRWRVTESAGSTKWGDALWMVVCTKCSTPRLKPVLNAVIHGKWNARCYVCWPVKQKPRPLNPFVREARENGLRQKHRLEYYTWQSMKQRCSRITHRKYPIYGGRGIVVCSQWLNSFKQFLVDVGPKPFKGASIDRIDPDGNYEPSNVRWATATQQANNKRKK